MLERIKVDGRAQLPEVGCAPLSTRALARFCEGRQKYCGKNADDGDNQKEFNQCKAGI
jgi:hypothetical protein